jgi:hypothetical protein
VPRRLWAGWLAVAVRTAGLAAFALVMVLIT